MTPSQNLIESVDEGFACMAEHVRQLEEKIAQLTSLVDDLTGDVELAKSRMVHEAPHPMMVYATVMHQGSIHTAWVPITMLSKSEENWIID